MKSRLVLWSVVALGAAACSPSDQQAQLAPVSVHAAARVPDVDVHAKITELVVDDRTAAEKSAYLDRLEQAIDHLGVSPEAAEANEPRALADMDKRRDLLRSDYTDVVQASSDEWPTVKARVEADLDEFTRAVRRASSHPAPSSPRAE